MKPAYRVQQCLDSKVPTPTEMEDQLSLEGYKVYRWCDPAGAVYDFHKHEEEQSHWVVSGALELTVEGSGTFFLRAGDRDYMPSGTLHSARVVGDEPVDYLIGIRS